MTAASSSAAGSKERATPIMLLLIVAGATYNALLAALNASGLAQNYSSVAIVEAAILGAAAVRVVTLPYRDVDALPLSLLYAGLVFAAYMSLVNGTVAIECLRNFVVIVVFTMIGSRCHSDQIHTLFRILSLAVITFLLIEIFDTELYVKIFSPARYYLNTRGVPLFSLDKSGLFRGALGFKGRFSLGLSSHRTASIFIEQVSLANYAGVLCVFMISRFPRLPLGDRALHLLLVGLILASNDSRTTLSLAAVCVVGFAVFPRLAAGTSLLVAPMILSAGALVIAAVGLSRDDDLRGRISTTIGHLSSFDVETFLGMRVDTIAAQADSGYCYVIASSSVVGLLVFCLFCAFAVPSQTAAQRRCLMATNLYIFLNLMIGGTAIFSIKVAAPLWALVGFMRASSDETRRFPMSSVLPMLDGSLFPGRQARRSSSLQPSSGSHG